MKTTSLLFISILLLFGCQQTSTKPTLEWKEIAPLPFPIANNAVAASDQNLFTFLGIESDKDYKAVSARAAMYSKTSSEWIEIVGLPDNVGRLASTAQVVNNEIYIFGGYTVAEDGSEKSTPEVFKLSTHESPYTIVSEMPVPVDDAVSLVYNSRYIYLISGWHDTDNVSNVQVYDTQENTWSEATPYIGSPVFGHTGGIVGNTMIIMDGVKVVPPENEGERRSFQMAIETIKGEINPDDPTQITWTVLPNHIGKPRYRAGAIGIESPRPMIVFAGGSDNPYNYNGIGYNGEPSQPIAEVIAYDLAKETWIELGVHPEPTMDHRGIVAVGQDYYLIGGMLRDQEVTDQVFTFSINY